MTDHDNQILTEIRELRADFQRYSLDMEGRTSVIETNMYSLIGNGQPGRVSRLEMSIDRLNRWKWWIAGGAATCSTLVGVLGWGISVLLK